MEFRTEKAIKSLFIFYGKQHKHIQIPIACQGSLNISFISDYRRHGQKRFLGSISKFCLIKYLDVENKVSGLHTKKKDHQKSSVESSISDLGCPETTKKLIKWNKKYTEGSLNYSSKDLISNDLFHVLLYSMKTVHVARDISV